MVYLLPLCPIAVYINVLPYIPVLPEGIAGGPSYFLLPVAGASARRAAAGCGAAAGGGNHVYCAAIRCGR